MKPPVPSGYLGTDPDQATDYSTLSPAEMAMAQWVQNWFMTEGIGVNMIMATKPQTRAFGLNDSPVGLLSWLSSYASRGRFMAWEEPEPRTRRGGRNHSRDRISCDNRK